MKKNILMLASEAVPYVKTGGLADVVGALPKALKDLGADVRIMIPLYSFLKNRIESELDEVLHFRMNYLGVSRYVGVRKAECGGITYYFIDNGDYFTCDVPYRDNRWDMEKFCFFEKAALAALPVLGFKPDVIHCHDWQTALVPLYIRDGYCDRRFYAGTKTVFTIHNLKFQGLWDAGTVAWLSELPAGYFVPDKLEFYGGGSMMKAGILYADAVTTVSPAYAREIMTPEYGEGLDGLLSYRSGALHGILNGIDYDIFDPANDAYLPSSYTADDFRKKKPSMKKRLQKELGLNADPKPMLFGMVSRLTSQKGLDLIEPCIGGLLELGAQLAVLGTGEEHYEELFRRCAKEYPGQVSVTVAYSEEIAHKIYAGCDAYLMPSRFEPCGLSQLIAMRYGTVPVVRETGGLSDTVEPYNEYEDTGTGFSFDCYDAAVLMKILRYAHTTYTDKRRAWNRIAERAMRMDYSWDASARTYLKLYESITK